MTREQAQREARKRWGTRALIRAGEKLSSPESRASALQRLRDNRDRRDAIDSEVQRRLNEMDWYKALMLERRACAEAVKHGTGWACYYKFSVGCDVGIAFHVKGQGDTWEEAFEAAGKASV